MEQIRKLVSQLSPRQRIVIGVCVLIAIAGLTAVSRWNTQRGFRPLYTGLNESDAGSVAAKLKELNVPYQVDGETGVILVPSARIAETRLQLAASGLPKTGRIGWELFDKSNFGITEFSEQVNFQRALEGELERSIAGISEVHQARVHLTFAKNSIFADDRRPAKASVVLHLKPGAQVSPQNILAITHLVSSAVEGLQPENVSLIDMDGNLLSRGSKTGSGSLAEETDSTIEYRRHIEQDLLAKVRTTLEPLVGEGNFRSQVWVDCDFTSGEQSEETFDPAKSVMVTSQRTEDVGSGATVAGVPGTASNLPRPAARPLSGSSANSRRTENITYQSSRLVRRLKLPQGNIKRLSLSILVAHTARWEGNGANAKRIVEPPAPEKLKVIRELVAAATGFQADRGDQLVVESLPFEPPETRLPPPVASSPAKRQGPEIPAWLGRWLDDKKIRPLLLPAGGAALGLFLAMAAGLYLRRKRKRKQLAVQLTKSLPPTDSDTAATPEELRKRMENKLAEQQAQRELDAQQVLSSLRLPSASNQKLEVLGKHVAEEARKEPALTAQVIRAWLNDQ